jgi:hypothetical protein
MSDPIEKGFHIVSIREEVETEPSPRARFEQRAEDLARAAESAGPESHDDVPFGLKRRIVLRVPILRGTLRNAARANDAAGEEDEEEILLPEGIGRAPEHSEELARIRGLVAQLALDLIARLLVINRYFADAGLVKSPEVLSPPPPVRGRRD